MCSAMGATTGPGGPDCWELDGIGHWLRSLAGFGAERGGERGEAAQHAYFGCTGGRLAAVYAADDGLVLSPTDLTRHLACAHLTTLDLAAARGELAAPKFDDEALDLIFRLGLEHEVNYLDLLQQRHVDVVVIPEKDPHDPDRDLDVSIRAQLTVEAMGAGAQVIYQATFLHDGYRGHADFLIRAERPSGLGRWSYDVADTKLARRMKVAALLQMADYGRHL